MTNGTKLLVGAAGAAGLWLYYQSLPEAERPRFQQLAEIGIVGSALAIPLGMWSLRKWPAENEHWKTAALMTGLGLAVKQIMLAQAESPHELELPAPGLAPALLHS